MDSRANKIGPAALKTRSTQPDPQPKDVTERCRLTATVFGKTASFFAYSPKKMPDSP
jgi:hypothetical protein